MRKGFTLLETLVAVMVLGTVVAAISGVLTTSMRNVGRAEDYQRVVLLARSQMHEMLALPAWKDGQTWKGEWSAGYRWSATVSRAPGPESAYDLMRLKLVGTWQTTRGNKNYTLETARLQTRTARVTPGGTQ